MHSDDMNAHECHAKDETRVQQMPKTTAPSFSPYYLQQNPKYVAVSGADHRRPLHVGYTQVQFISGVFACFRSLLIEDCLIELYVIKED